MTTSALFASQAVTVSICMAPTDTVHQVAQRVWPKMINADNKNGFKTHRTENLNLFFLSFLPLFFSFSSFSFFSSSRLVIGTSGETAQVEKFCKSADVCDH
jgi:hypothetical protein